MENDYELMSCLLSDFDFICYFDIDTDSEKIIRSDPWYESLYPGWEEENSFLERVEFIFHNLVDESEREKFSKLCRKDVICRELRERKVYGFNYKALVNGQGVFYQMSFAFSDKSGQRLIMGMHSVDQEMRKQIQIRSKHAQNKTLIGVMNADYSSVFYIDAVSGIITSNSLKNSDDNIFASYFRTGFLIREAYRNFTEELAFQPDREMLRKLIEDNNVIKVVSDRKSISSRFRYIKDGRPHFAEMKLVKLEYGADIPPMIVMGISDNEASIIGNYIDEELEDDYIGICLVDLDADVYFLRKNDSEAFPQDSDGFRWSTEVKAWAEDSTEDTCSFVTDYNDPIQLKSFLKHENRVEFLYKHELAHDMTQWRREAIQVVERRNGAPGTVIVTVSILDRNAADREELNRQIYAQSELLENQHMTMERELKSAQAANDAKSAFLFNVSHDIRTPMNAIIGYTAMAKKYSNDKLRVESYMEKIDMAGNQLLALVNQVLEMSRIESGKIILELTRTDIIERSYELVAIVGTSARAKDIDLTLNVVNIKHRSVLADKGRISQIMLNVLGNSVKYTPECGKISFTVEEIPCGHEGYGSFVFTVEDNGIGMSQEFQEHVFDEFTRERSSTVSGIQGTGLGMAIVKRLLDLMGGRIKIDSELGKGTKVSVSLTFRLWEDGIEEVKTEECYEIERIAGRKILLVEDNEMNREIAKDILEDFGVDVTEAEDGTEAVEIVRNAGDGDFDAILMDIQMPVMNGYEASRIIRNMGCALSGIPIIAMTANAFIEDRQMALESGMDEHLAKPIDIDKLKVTLLRFLR